MNFKTCKKCKRPYSQIQQDGEVLWVKCGCGICHHAHFDLSDVIENGDKCGCALDEVLSNMERNLEKYTIGNLVGEEMTIDETFRYIVNFLRTEQEKGQSNDYR